MLRLLNFRCSFCSNPLDETQRDRTLRPLQSRTHSQCESAWVSTPQKTGPRAPGVDSVLMSRSVLSVLAWTGQTAH